MILKPYERNKSKLLILSFRASEISIYKDWGCIYHCLSVFFLQWRERLENKILIFLPPVRRNSGYGHTTNQVVSVRCVWISQQSPRTPERDSAINLEPQAWNVHMVRRQYVILYKDLTLEKICLFTTNQVITTSAK